MKTIKNFIIFAMVFVFACILVSCQTMSAVAQVAGAAGVINQNAANAISQSAEAIGKAAEDITPEQEYYIGRAVGANILGMYNVYDGDWDLIFYLNRICGTITINSPRPDIYNGYRVAILNTDEINAFAT